MRVLLVNHFPLEGSGSGTYTKNIAQHLAKRGNDVCVVFPENRQPSPIEGIELRPVYFTAADEEGSPLSGALPNSIPNSPSNALPFNFPCFTTHPRSLAAFDDLSDEQLEDYLGAFTDAIECAIREFQPDIIHAQHVWLLADAAARSAAKVALEGSTKPIPTILTAHGTDMMGYKKWERFRPIADDAVERAAKIIAISKDNYDDTVDTIPAAKDKMVLLLNGYNEDIFYMDESADDARKSELMASHNIPYHGERIVLFAGKLTNFKGVDTLLRAAALYEPAHPDTITLLAGSGEEREMLEALHAELGLERTYFLGHQSQDDLRQLYNIADVFAMPSRREPFGLVALEAMACGLAVVATNQGGLVEFVTDEVGRLVDVDDAPALAEAIVQELDLSAGDPDRSARIAKFIFDNYAQSKFVIKLEELYRQVM